MLRIFALHLVADEVHVGKQRRLAEPLTRHGKPVKGSQVQGATVNREISCLVGALNLACDQGLCDGAPKGQEGARDRA